jgi:hypothetical protein
MGWYADAASVPVLGDIRHRRDAGEEGGGGGEEGGEEEKKEEGEVSA